jgi:hypothetical protein
MQEDLFDIRSGSGLGDAIYINSVVQELLKEHSNIILRTKYPGVFASLPIRTKEFTKGGENLAFNYGGSLRRRKTSNIYEDLLQAAGLPMDTEMGTAWEYIPSKISDQVLEVFGKMAFISSPHVPFGRNDGRGDKMIPNWKKFQPLIDRCKELGYYTVMAGSGKLMHEFKNIDLNLHSQTSVHDIMNIGQMSDLFIGQCGFVIPLGEGFKKPTFTILARAGLDDKDDWFINNVTLTKILSRLGTTSNGAIDDEPDSIIMERFNGIC